LPDSNAILRKIAERVGAAGQDAHSLLTEIGRDCVGALQFLPIDADIPNDWYAPEGLSPTTHIFKPAIGTLQWEMGNGPCRYER